jgi:hypothetical protein
MIMHCNDDLIDIMCIKIQGYRKHEGLNARFEAKKSSY